MNKSKSQRLQKEGATFQVMVRPSKPIIDMRTSSGQDVEHDYVNAVIDTGAEGSMIALSTLNDLGFVPHDFRPRVSTQGVKENVPIYDITLQLQFANTNEPVEFYVQVAALELDKFGTFGLIGRDILSQCELHYNGPKGTYELKFKG